MPKSDGQCGNEPQPRTIDEHIDDFDDIQILY